MTIVAPNRHPLREARRLSKADHPSDQEGYCLRQTRKAYGVGPRADAAAEAWVIAEAKHHETDPHKIPRGVPVFWLGGSHGHGHIAISTGDGECWSTDIERPGYWDKVPIDQITSRWGLSLVGWTEDLNGVRVWKENGK